MKQKKIKSVAKKSVEVNTDELTIAVDAKRTIVDLEGLLAAIVQSSEDAIVSKTLEGIVTSWNPAAERLFGYTSTEMVGQPTTKLIPKDRLNEEPEILKKIQAGEIIAHFETQRVSKVGKLIDISLTISPVKDIKGNIIGASKIARDITNQIEARRRIQENEIFNHTILESSPDCVKVINGEGKIQFMNTNGLCAMEIDDFDNLKNELWSSLWGEDYIQTVEKALATALEGKTAQFQAFCPTAKGTPKWWDILVSPVLVSGVEKISTIISVSRDITKQIESNKKIEESEHLYRQIFNFSPVAIWEKDDEALYREIELLKTNGITNFRKYLDENPSEIMRLVSFVKLKNVNDESIHLLEAESKEEILSGFHKLFTEESIPVLKEGIIGVAEEKKRLNIHSVLKSFKGNKLEILFGFDFRIGNSINESLVTLTDVTATKNAERALKQSDERLRLATQTSGVGIWEWNVITNKIRWDTQMFHIYGVTPTADGFIEYQTWSNAVVPEELAEQEKILQDTVKNSSTSNRSFKIYRANNHQLRYIEAIETVRTNANGQAEWVVGTNIDVTERKIAEEQLIKLATHLDLSTTSAGVGVWLLDINSEQLEWSAQHKRMWGYNENRTDLGYEDWHKVIHPEDKERCFAEVETAKKEKRKYEVDYRIYRANDGVLRWVKSVGQYQYNDNGQAVTLTGISIDITDAKIAEDVLKESEERFRSLVQALPQLVWVTDAQGNPEFASFRWKEYTGIEPRGEKEWKAIVHPDDYDGINAAWVQSLTTGNIYTFDVRLKSKNGEYRWYAVKGEPVLDKENKIIKWVGAFTDIQDQKVREEKKDEFISIASHEMKTPLTTAKAYLQMLEISLYESNDDANLYAKKASQSINRLNELISELLDVSKIRLGKLNYTFTTFNFNDMVENTVESMQYTSPTHTIIMTGKVNVEVTGDKERLQQVVINLLTNAIKYSPGAEKVFITVEQEKDMIKVSVKDTGIGIAEQSLDKIFEKYHRVEEHAVHFQGLGIGLFISYEIIQRHHGKLWAESEVGKGSTFYFSLPLKPDVLIQ